MDQRLIDVAKTGDVDAFYALLREDQYILEGIDLAPFVNTPLHIAIEARKTAFAVEIANLKPSFARKLNQDGVSPIHLASKYGNLEILCKLLSKDHELCLLEGRGNKIPLHFAAEAGEVDVMKALLKDCPDSIGMLTVCKETPLHLAAKNGQVEACKVILDSMVELNRPEIFKWMDENGKTAQDVAAGSPEVVALLVNENHTVLEEKVSYAETDRTFKDWLLKLPVTNDSRNAMLVVLALIISALFQAAVSPPGGVWQDTSTTAHDAGEAVMGHTYIGFVNNNAAGFCASVWAIILLTNDIPLKFQSLLMVSILVLTRAYDTSIEIINPGQHHHYLRFNFTYSSIFLTLTSFFVYYSFAFRVVCKLLILKSLKKRL